MSVVVYDSFEIAAPGKIPSVNSMYKPKSMFGKSFAWLYKDAKVETYQNSLIAAAKTGNFAKVCKYKDSIDYIDIKFIFLLDKNFYKRDVSNMVKMTEDALMQVTEVDDSKHRSISAFKALSLIPKKEFVICKYEISFNEDK